MATAPRNAWYCPVCGTRLSYGVYCKRCKSECSLAWRPPNRMDRLRKELESFPPPSYPRFVED